MEGVVEQVAPIYRLDASSWTRIGYYLGGNGATRLCCTGSTHLATVVRSQVRDLNLEWTSLRFIDMHQVMAHMTPFKSLTSFIFRQDGCTRRSWTPVQWTLLPSTLTSLSLCFLGAPTELLGPSNNILEACPHLEHIILEDDLPLSYDNQRDWLTDQPFEDNHLVLSYLPSTLLSLHIVSQRLMTITRDLSELPADLEDLELNFPIIYKFPDFPQLPGGLKRLFLHDPHHNWTISCMELPASLESFELFTYRKACIIGLDTPWTGNFDSKIDMTGAATHLVNLKRILAPRLCMTVDQALDLLPPSVTLLDVQLVSKGYSRLEEAIEKLGPKLLAFYNGTWPEMEDHIFYEEWSPLFPNLHTLIAEGGLPLDYLPESVTSLTIKRVDDIGDLPRHLKEFKTVLLPNKLVWTPSHKLTSIMWRSGKPPTGWAEALPDTLERLVAPFEIDDWRSLMSVMTLTSRLPNLSHVVVFGHVESLFLEYLTPRQLKKVALHFYEIGPLSDALLSSLPQSTVEELWIESDESKHDHVMALLNHLPQKLKTLCFYSCCEPSPDWPVTLPNTLTSLSLVGSYYEGRRETEKMSFVFPPSLTQLHLTPSDDFPEESLPLLSLYDGERLCCSPGEPPFPDQELAHYIFKDDQYHLPGWLDLDFRQDIKYLECSDEANEGEFEEELEEESEEEE